MQITKNLHAGAPYVSYCKQNKLFLSGRNKDQARLLKDSIQKIAGSIVLAHPVMHTTCNAHYLRLLPVFGN